VRHAMFVPNFGTFSDPRLVVDLAARCESMGWDGWFYWDHVVHQNANEPAADPWMTLGACAMATERILLGPMITPLPRRRPWNVARQAVTLDQMSKGRAVLGVGIGATGTHEYAEFGEEEDLVKRGAMLDEGLELIQELWRGEEMHHRGEHYKVEGIRFRPVPVSKPLPIWIGAVWPNRRPLRRAARFDGVFPIRLPGPETLAEVLAITGEVKGVVVLADDHPADAWEKAGATWLLHGVPFIESIERVEQKIDDGPV
jgi:alkanesulfonate monooxygenase SsuD/methylene tetrahydromethanopterin reductase-like flavin-dependent oxidoreductase (luciferase family)